MSRYTFEVEIRDFELLSGKVKRMANKKDLADRIVNEARNQAEIAYREIGSIPVKMEVWFYLWKGGKGVTNTTSKKDIDNLLKLVFDALQPFVDSQKTTRGAGIIDSDGRVLQVKATKEIVDDKSTAGLKLVISAY